MDLKAISSLLVVNILLTTAALLNNHMKWHNTVWCIVFMTLKHGLG